MFPQHERGDPTGNRRQTDAGTSLKAGIEDVPLHLTMTSRISPARSVKTFPGEVFYNQCVRKMKVTCWGCW